MLSRTSSRELTEQYEFYRRHPYGDDWRQIAKLCYVMACGLLKGQFNEDQFMPFQIPVELRKQTDEEVESIVGPMLASASKKSSPKQKPKKKCKNGDNRKP